MKKLLVSLGLLSLLLVPVRAQVTAQPGQRFGFDYKPADVTAYQVTRFELQIDDGAWTDVQIPPTATDANTLPDHVTYAVAIPALTPGAHAYAIRACNAAGCGGSSAAFPFTMVVVPPAAVNQRILGGPVPAPEPGSGPGEL